MEQVELWDLLLGLELAWAKGYKKVIIETDSKLAFWLVKRSDSRLGTSNVTIKKCLDLIAREWEVEVSHIHKEMNGVAGGLCK